ncbi:MAG TPA: class I SAM-dependent methyltransferase [Thermoanaerobaculia bacterium]|jgi:hypothetical protein|nr:class I SAM-dependent methyltransferase [Thermoanaerobaculia bacterium]
MEDFSTPLAPETRRLLAEISRLPPDWHGAGSLRPKVLEAIARHAASRRIEHSAETGTGRSTLLFSHLCPNHVVFTADDRGNGDSLDLVRSSPLLRAEAVTFVIGPTQRTLPRHAFEHPLQLALIDGPHAYPFPELEYFALYPHLSEDALLVLDDIDVPTLFHLFRFLKEEAMFRHLETVHTTALFARTKAPCFEPCGDGWWLQNYNRSRYPITDPAIPLSPLEALKRRVPAPVKGALKKVLRGFRT